MSIFSWFHNPKDKDLLHNECMRLLKVTQEQEAVIDELTLAAEKISREVISVFVEPEKYGHAINFMRDEINKARSQPESAFNRTQRLILENSTYGNGVKKL